MNNKSVDFNYDLLLMNLIDNTNDWKDEHGNFDRAAILRTLNGLFNGKAIYFRDELYLWNGYYYAQDGDKVLSRLLQNVSAELSSRMIRSVIESFEFTHTKSEQEIKQMLLPEYYIPLINGLFNINTMKLEEHNPNYFYTYIFNITYNPEAVPFYTIWFLFRRFKDNFYEFFKILEVFAYMLFRDNRFQVIPIFLGESKEGEYTSGHEGKTTTIRIFSKVIGEENTDWTTLKQLVESEFNFINLRGKILHVMSLDEADEIYGFESVIERLRDPVITSMVKRAVKGVTFPNTALHILVGNTLPKNRKKTIAFFRSIKLIVHFRLPLGNDWVFLDFIDEQEKSGIFNLLITIYKIQRERKGLYGLLSLEDTEKQYKHASNSFLSFLSEIFEKDRNNELEREDVMEYINILAENLNVVIPENISTAYLTRVLHELFNVRVKRTTTHDNDGSIHKTYYTGIRFKYDYDKVMKGEIFNIGELPKEKVDKNLDTFKEYQNALQDYLSTVPNDMSIQISRFFPFFNPYIQESRLYNNNREQKVDNWIKVFEMLLDADSSVYPTLYHKFGHNLDKVSLEGLRLFLEKELGLLKYFKSHEYFGQEYFQGLGVESVDYFNFKGWHYYALKIPEAFNSSEKTFE
ncbi:MAG: hypothetical protein F9Y92_07495, partial [Thermoplasmatales archaeon]|nr:hypothetical protein [Thermoplasmatales archaeon]